MATFMDIPMHARKQVYRYAGLILDDMIVLEPRKGTFDTSGPGQTSEEEYWREREKTRSSHYEQYISTEAECFQMTYRLLTVSRKVSSEVKAWLCSSNTFIVSCFFPAAGLRFLRTLTPEMIRRVKNLHIHLYVARPLIQEEGWFGSGDPTRPNRKMITLWHDTANHILTNTQKSQLNLTLICETGDSAVTSNVLRPLLRFPGHLKNFQLRLHRNKHDRSKRLAFRAGRYIQGCGNHDKSPFRFFDLPPEIRHAILLCTDLRIPTGQVCWSSQRGYGTVLPGKPLWGVYYGPIWYYHPGFAGCDENPSGLTGTCCPARVSGYSTRCQCWEPPRALFLVSRRMCREALAVLYSENRVIVWTPSLRGRFGSLLHGPESRFRMEPSRFITRHTWPEALNSLRRLDLVLPPFDHETPREPPKAQWLDWCFAVEHLLAHAKLDSLRLSVYMTLRSNWLPVTPLRVFHKLAREEGDGLTALFRKQKIYLEPLQRLRGIGAFFVHLEWPWHFSPDTERLAEKGLRHHSVSGRELYSRVAQMEVSLEKFVMGEDYDSHSRGKSVERPNDWLLNWWGCP